MKTGKFASRSWFILGVLSAATVGAFANLPSTGDTSGSMAPTQDVSEIRAKRHVDLSFDGDLKHLSAIQGRYRENLPLTKRKAGVDAIRTRQSVRAPAPKKVRSSPLPAPRPRAKVGQN